jgi:hypothetical protein
MIKYCLLSASLLLLFCFRNPAQLGDQTVADCSHPTYPKTPITDSNQVDMVMEIYDFQQRLVNYGENHDILSPAPIDTPISYNLYWNGMYLDGKPADPGHYLVKVSVIYGNKMYRSRCHCADIFMVE